MSVTLRHRHAIRLVDSPWSPRGESMATGCALNLLSGALSVRGSTSPTWSVTCVFVPHFIIPVLTVHRQLKRKGIRDWGFNFPFFFFSPKNYFYVLFICCMQSEASNAWNLFLNTRFRTFRKQQTTTYFIMESCLPEKRISPSLIWVIYEFKL